VTDATLPRDPQHLDATSVRATVARLGHRISTRFPERNLRRLPGHLLSLIDDVERRSLLQHGRTRWVRVASRVMIALMLASMGAALLWVGVQAGAASGPNGWAWVGVVESLINDLVFAAIAIVFLWALPTRLERRDDLAVLHRLRSLAHVVDMHQLTKDPERLEPRFHQTAATQPLGLTVDELANYLDYCSEMLSLIAKTAALFAERTTDAAVLSTVEGIEDLTIGMSRKIWAKIALLPRTVAGQSGR
jgi:hypothetical protein